MPQYILTIKLIPHKKLRRTLPPSAQLGTLGTDRYKVYTLPYYRNVHVHHSYPRFHWMEWESFFTPVVVNRRYTLPNVSWPLNPPAEHSVLTFADIVSTHTYHITTHILPEVYTHTRTHIHTHTCTHTHARTHTHTHLRAPHARASSDIVFCAHPFLCALSCAPSAHPHIMYPVCSSVYSRPCLKSLQSQPMTSAYW